ncbi:MAG: ferredoxin-thioredoxin reductase catalytic domain-containing protein [candidate division WOR-3 bacterium]
MRAEVSAEVLRTYDRLKAETEAAGYRLNPDRDFVLSLIQGLLENQQRYGYWACPCRLASGEKAKDIDIICPCYYRDSDIEEYGACYCGLYVSDDWIAGKVPHRSIPERRPADYVFSGYSERSDEQAGSTNLQKLAYPVWRCKVCGYLAARPEPPGKCPICKATRDRFERFL